MVKGDQRTAELDGDGRVDGVAPAQAIRGRQLQSPLGEESIQRDEDQVREAADGPGELAGQDRILTTARDGSSHLRQQQRGNDDRDGLCLKAGQQPVALVMPRLVRMQVQVARRASLSSRHRAERATDTRSPCMRSWRSVSRRSSNPRQRSDVSLPGSSIPIIYDIGTCATQIAGETSGILGVQMGQRVKKR